MLYLCSLFFSCPSLFTIFGVFEKIVVNARFLLLFGDDFSVNLPIITTVFLCRISLLVLLFLIGHFQVRGKMLAFFFDSVIIFILILLPLFNGLLLLGTHILRGCAFFAQHTHDIALFFFV